MNPKRWFSSDWLLVVPLALFFVIFVGVPLALVAFISLHTTPR